ncbi:MAG: SurA N-terminal domain-containing protein [Beijerinckiaceae bacterium]|nr:SurA N-terminal domain-containing protein [Beijerinckiaceae bacterium]
MMDRLRIASQGIFGRLVMALILGVTIIGFGFWGIGDIFRDYDPNELARAGSARITVDMYRDAYQNELQRVEQNAKRAITSEEAQRLGLDRQVLARLLTDAVLDQEARKLGLAIGDADIANTIRKDDSFKGPDGKFDKARFDAILRENGFSETRFVNEQRAIDLRQYVSDAVISGIELPKLVEEAIHRYKTETRQVDFVVLTPALAGDIPAPSDADLQKYFDDRKSAYTAPEYRKLVTLAVIPADLVKPDAVSDADVQKRYDDTKAIRFVTPEKRTLQQIVFPSEAAATEAEAKLASGTSFQALAAERKLSDKDIDLGTLAADEVHEKATADAAFALAEGAVSQPVKTQFGYAVVRAVKIFPRSEIPFMAVSAQLKDEVAIIRAKTEAKALRDKIEEQRSAGKTLTEAAASAGLKTQTIEAVDAQGRDKANKPVEGLVEGPALLKAAFAAEVGSDTDMISTATGGYSWFEVAGIEPARQLSLADAKTKVEASWHRDEVAKRLSAKADNLVKALNGGQALSALAETEGKLQVQHASDVKRDNASTLPGNVSTAVFAVAAHKAGSAGLPDGGRFVFQVQDARVPPLDGKNPDFKKLMDQVKSGVLDDVLGEYLSRLEQQFDVKVNARALAAVSGAGAGGGS